MKQIFGGKGTIRRLAVIVGCVAGLCLGLMTLATSGWADGRSLASGRSPAIQALSENPKLMGAGDILKDFEDGKSRTRVIVNLRRPEKAAQFQEFGDMGVRQALKQAVSEAQDAVIKGLDPVEVVITNRFTYQFGFSADVSLKGLQSLVDHAQVLSIEPDRLLHAHLAQGIDLMNAYDASGEYDGAGISIAICDTGIDYTHPMLGMTGFPNIKVIGGYDCGDDDPLPIDQNGHGTACAGIAAGDIGFTGDYIGGVAFGAKLYAVKISQGSGGTAYDSDMIEGWEWCITHQNDDPGNPILIISTSFGGGRYLSSCDSTSTAMTAAAANAVAAGMTLFVSSGNDGYCDAISWTACISHVISVGAVYDANIGRNPPTGYVGCIDSDSCVGNPAPPCDEKWYVDEPANADQVATYSNSASILNLLAPAEWATTTKLAGGYWDVANGFGGTSAACPYAAGAAASLQNAAKVLKGSYLTPAEVKSLLAASGDLITDGKVSITKPRVNLGRAVASLGGSIVYVEPAGTCGGNSPCSATIQGAIDLAGAGTTLKIASATYSENIVLNEEKDLIFEGGYDATYSSRSGESILQTMTIRKGTAVIDRLTF